MSLLCLTFGLLDHISWTFWSTAAYVTGTSCLTIGMLWPKCTMWSGSFDTASQLGFDSVKFRKGPNPVTWITFSGKFPIILTSRSTIENRFSFIECHDKYRNLKLIITILLTEKCTNAHSQTKLSALDSNGISRTRFTYIDWAHMCRLSK